MDCERPNIARPLLQIQIDWITVHNRHDTLSEAVTERMIQIFLLIKKRFAYPRWCELSMEPNELEVDYQSYREELMTGFINLTLIRPIHASIVEKLYESF